MSTSLKASPESGPIWQSACFCRNTNFPVRNWKPVPTACFHRPDKPFWHVFALDKIMLQLNTTFDISKYIVIAIVTLLPVVCIDLSETRCFHRDAKMYIWKNNGSKLPPEVVVRNRISRIICYISTRPHNEFFFHISVIVKFCGKNTECIGSQVNF